MKKLLLISTLVIGSATPYIAAEMRYNPLNNLLYSHPETSDINQADYRLLLVGCMQLENRLIAMNNGMRLPSSKVLEQCNFYLQAVGTPTALRLIKDLKKNTVHYANGSFMKKIFQ